MAHHPTAVIDSRARIDPTAEVGPHTVIDGHVELGPGCRVGPLVHLTGWTRIGAGNSFGAGCVIGGPPQDLRYGGEPTRLEIGEGNTFREHVTVHCANRADEPTRIGSGGFFMAHCHVGHNAQIGDRVIIANGAQLGGHVVIEDMAFISANCLIHQFVRVGTLALMQGDSGISKDLAPFCIARDHNRVCGLNVIGLRRAGLPAAVRLELRRIYHALFRTGLGFRAALAAAEPLAESEWGLRLVTFAKGSRRGLVTERRHAAQGRPAPGEESGDEREED
ncbi:MAG: acyl-ACP--UDP-N-acetylglucosamine O-acyltransferase [Verrucomicrobiae bacterium]|nr:acyl-ACP--UDP-N-acetylglucosamine O-acyltransferase [Verrucomicrobiae bacterium]